MDKADIFAKITEAITQKKLYFDTARFSHFAALHGATEGYLCALYDTSFITLEEFYELLTMLFLSKLVVTPTEIADKKQWHESRIDKIIARSQSLTRTERAE